MPQVQFLDIPNIGTAVGKFGNAFMEETLANSKKNQEEDALQAMLADAKERIAAGESPDAVAATILGTKNVPFERRLSTADMFSKSAERAENKRIANEKLAREEENRKIANKRADEAAKLSRQKYGLDLKKLDRKEQDAYAKETDPLKISLGTLEEMENLVKKGNIGRGSTALALNPFATETQSDIGAYEIAAKSLITMVSTMNIRNQKEFEAMAGKLTDPNLPNAEKRGLLEKLKSRVTRELNLKNQRYKDRIDGGGESKSQSQEYEKIRFNPSDEAHKQRALEILQLVNGDRKRANEIMAEEFTQ